MRATQGTLKRNGIEIEWWLTAERPDDPLVVCTHGGAMDHRMWKPQVSALANRYRVLTYDVRGHGASHCTAAQFSLQAARDDLAALIDSAGVQSAILVGHSFGATISQLLALEQPSRVRALVGVGAACATMPSSVTARVRQSMNPLALRVLGQKRLRAMFADMAGTTPGVKAYAREAISMLNDDMFEAVMRTGFGRSVPVPIGYTLGVPLLLLQGDKEQYGAFLGGSKRWAERDGGRLISVPGAAHNANQDAPEFVNAEILSFLSGPDH